MRHGWEKKVATLSLTPSEKPSGPRKLHEFVPLAGFLVSSAALEAG